MQWCRVSNKEMEAKKKSGRRKKAALQDRVRVFSAARAWVAKLPEAEKQVAYWTAALMASSRVSSQESLRVRQELSRAPASARASKPVQGSNCPAQRPYPYAAPWQRRREIGRAS